MYNIDYSCFINILLVYDYNFRINIRKYGVKYLY